jgi:hypothetical protein
MPRFPLEDPVISSGFSAQPVSQFENEEIDLAAAGKSTTFCQKLCRRIPDPVSACTHIFSSGVADFVMLHGVGNIRYHPGRRRLKDERVQMSESDYDLSSKQWFQSINWQNQLLFFMDCRINFFYFRDGRINCL